MKAKLSKKKIVDPRGQWAHPGEVTTIPSNNITMQGVNYPVFGIPNVGEPRMMYPGEEHNFEGADSVTEYPQIDQAQFGGNIVTSRVDYTPIKTMKVGGKVIHLIDNEAPMAQKGGAIRDPREGTQQEYNMYQDSSKAYLASQKRLPLLDKAAYDRDVNDRYIMQDKYDAVNKVAPKYTPKFKNNGYNPLDFDIVSNSTSGSTDTHSTERSYTQPVQPIIKPVNSSMVVNTLTPISTSIRNKEVPYSLPSLQNQLTNNNQPLEFNSFQDNAPKPIDNGYFTRPRQSGESGNNSFPDRNKAIVDKFDKRTGKLIEQVGGKVQILKTMKIGGKILHLIQD